jgi:hypothetical protein
VDVGTNPRGTLASVRNNGTAYTTIEWYGGNAENLTTCSEMSAALNGNGAQRNNFAVGRNASNKAHIIVRSNDTSTYSVYVERQNWVNGTGCPSLAP